MANGIKDFYDFLATVKGMNPAIDIRGSDCGPGVGPPPLEKVGS